jgi:hypothetical protein
LKPAFKSIVEENFSELAMSKTQSPKSQVASSVRNCAQDEFDRFNQLVNKYVTKTVFSRPRFDLDRFLDLHWWDGHVADIVIIFIDSIVDHLPLLFVFHDQLLWLVMLLMLSVEVEWFHKQHKRYADQSHG